MRIGAKTLHTTPRGLVARAGQVPKLSQSAFDSKGNRIGSVSDVFGPVKSPYIVIKPASGLSETDLRKLVGSDIYMGEKRGKSCKKGVPRVRKR